MAENLTFEAFEPRAGLRHYEDTAAVRDAWAM
jgi:hypothetical protein